MSLQVVRVVNTEAQKSQDEGRHPPRKGQSSESGADLLRKTLICILSYWLCVAIFWQHVFNAAGSTNVQKENEYLLETIAGTGNFFEVMKKPISVTFIIKRIVLEFNSKIKGKKYMSIMGSNPSSTT